MKFIFSKWMRTFVWLFFTALVFIFLINQYLFNSPYIWLIIGAYCLLNVYLEFIVSAIFISPGATNKSFESEYWKSHFREFESVTTHIQTFQQGHIAPLIVLIHGWRSNSLSLQGRAEWFVEKGFHVVICELPGHGKSTSVQRWNALTATKHMKFHIKHLHDLIEPQHVSHVILYGHSMGGYICTQISTDELNIAYDLPLTGLILESPLMLYSKILDEIRDQLKIPSILRPLHLRRLFRDIRAMHPSIKSNNLNQFDIPHWGNPSVPTLCLQAMTDNRLGREHYDATVEVLSKHGNLTHHLIESLSHSGAKTNEVRERHLLEWLETFESLILT